MALENDFLEKTGLVTNGKITDKGWEVFSLLLDHVTPYPNLAPHPVFLKFMSKIVPTAMELLIIRDGKVFLTWRDDEFFKGWHVPGSYIAPRETLFQTAQRIADRETPGIKITSARIVESTTHPDSPRFHDACLLVAVTFEGDTPETETGKWFAAEPMDLISVHRSYWPTIKRLLKQ